MAPTRDHTAQHFSVQHLVFHNENLHGIPPFGKTIGDFLGQSNIKNRASDAIFILQFDIVQESDMRAALGTKRKMWRFHLTTETRMP
jgi:hypothetical protein